MCILRILLIIPVVLSQENYDFFRKDYVYDKTTETFYKIHTIRRSWTDAKVKCTMEGASLYVPNDEQEANLAVHCMKEKGLNEVYVGIQDILSEGEFTTVDNVPVDEVYHKWDNGEPNDASNNEDCVILKTSGKYNDVPCNDKFPFLCEKHKSTVFWNSQCEIANPEYVLDKDLGKCYKVHLNPSNWTEAYASCQSEESHLAIINSQKEAELFVRLLEQAPVNSIKENFLHGVVHLGFHNQFSDGFTTIHGEKLSSTGYDTWANGQPDNAGNNEKCGSMFLNSQLNDVWCGSKCLFICEHDIEYAGDLGIRFGEKDKPKMLKLNK